MLHDPRRLLTPPAGSPWNPTNGRRFAYPLADTDDALRWVRSLYLPGGSPRRIRAAQRLTRRWAGSSIGIPLRVVAVRTRHASVSGFLGLGELPLASMDQSVDRVHAGHATDVWPGPNPESLKEGR